MKFPVAEEGGWPLLPFDERSFCKTVFLATRLTMNLCPQKLSTFRSNHNAHVLTKTNLSSGLERIKYLVQEEQTLFDCYHYNKPQQNISKKILHSTNKQKKTLALNYVIFSDPGSVQLEIERQL
jgi:hypothetical protein